MSFWRIRTTGGSKEESGFRVAKRTQILLVSFINYKTEQTTPAGLALLWYKRKKNPQDAPKRADGHWLNNIKATQNTQEY